MLHVPVEYSLKSLKQCTATCPAERPFGLFLFPQRTSRCISSGIACVLRCIRCLFVLSGGLQYGIALRMGMWSWQLVLKVTWLVCRCRKCIDRSLAGHAFQLVACRTCINRVRAGLVMVVGTWGIWQEVCALPASR